MTPRYATVEDYLDRERPEEAIWVFRPLAIREAVAAFHQNFPGDIYYPVKANDHPLVLSELWRCGVAQFDVASIGEHERVRAIAPTAELAFTHPVASRHALVQSRSRFGVRRLTVDHPSQFEVIRERGLLAADVVVSVRLRTESRSASYDLGRKFGAEPQDAAPLLKAIAGSGAKAGLSVHCGSQCIDLGDFNEAMLALRRTIDTANVAIDTINVGGGFPIDYAYDPSTSPVPVPSVRRVLSALLHRLDALDLMRTPSLIVEPGRSMVGRAASKLVRIDHRRGNDIYINSGVWHGLSEACTSDLILPARLVGRESPSGLQPFQVWGCTCDSIDTFRTQVWLPADIATGDYIEFGHVGAYATVLATGFSGFGPHEWITVDDAFDAPNLQPVNDAPATSGMRSRPANSDADITALAG